MWNSKKNWVRSSRIKSLNLSFLETKSVVNGSSIREVQNLVYKLTEGNLAKCQLPAVLLVNVVLLSVDSVICWRAINLNAITFYHVLHQMVVVEVAWPAVLWLNAAVSKQSSLSERMATDWLDKSAKKWEHWDCLCCLLAVESWYIAS